MIQESVCDTSVLCIIVYMMNSLSITSSVLYFLDIFHFLELFRSLQMVFRGPFVIFFFAIDSLDIFATLFLRSKNSVDFYIILPVSTFCDRFFVLTHTKLNSKSIFSLILIQNLIPFFDQKCVIYPHQIDNQSITQFYSIPSDLDND